MMPCSSEAVHSKSATKFLFILVTISASVSGDASGTSAGSSSCVTGSTTAAAADDDDLEFVASGMTFEASVSP